MNEIRPGIYQLQIPIPNNPLGYTNTYLVQGDDGYFLIDAGVNTKRRFNLCKSNWMKLGLNLETSYK